MFSLRSAPSPPVSKRMVVEFRVMRQEKPHAVLSVGS